jgi:hypothetical protein
MQAYSNLSKHEEKWEEIKRIPEIIWTRPSWYEWLSVLRLSSAKSRDSPGL